VPFGEYLPAQRLLEAIGLQQIVRQRGGFRAGRWTAHSLLTFDGLGKVLPLICYEVIFPMSPIADGLRPDLF